MTCSFSTSIHGAKCHEFGEKERNKIKLTALALYSSDLNDHVSKTQMTLFFVLRLCLIK